MPRRGGEDETVATPDVSADGDEDVVEERVNESPLAKLQVRPRRNSAGSTP